MAFVHALSFGVSYDDGRYWKQCERTYIRLLNKDAGLSRQEQEDANVIHALVKNCVHNRRFVVTKLGYYRLAPLCAQENDVCCIIFGVETHLILRRAEREGHYLTVGIVAIPGKEWDYNIFPKMDEEDENLSLFGMNGAQDWEEYGLEEQDIYLC
jgi:hypothetical protein